MPVRDTRDAANSIYLNQDLDMTKLLKAPTGTSNFLKSIET